MTDGVGQRAGGRWRRTSQFEREERAPLRQFDDPSDRLGGWWDRSGEPDQRGGRIILLASITALTARLELIAYFATKGAVLSLMKGMALELAQHEGHPLGGR